MAKQMEGFIEGTIDDITFYKMGGEYYARMKTSLTGKKFWKHRSFEGSRRSCGRFGRGNKLASLVYNEIAEERREYSLYCKMKSAAIRMIKIGKTEEEVVDSLREMKPKERIWEFENLKMWQLERQYVVGRNVTKMKGKKKIISQFGKELNRKGRGERRGKLRFRLREREGMNRGERRGRRVRKREMFDLRSERERSIWQFENLRI